MQVNRIICPSCGAENTQYGKCEYCGSEIKPLAADPDGGKVAHGIHKIDIDERVLKQEYYRFSDTTVTTTPLDLGYFHRSVHVVNGDEVIGASDDYYIELCHRQTGWDNGEIICNVNMTILVDGKRYEVKKDCPIDKNTLFALCTAQAQDICIYDPEYDWEGDVRDIYYTATTVTPVTDWTDDFMSIDNINNMILAARVYYFAFFDNTQFKESLNDSIEESNKKGGCLGVLLLFVIIMIGVFC